MVTNTTDMSGKIYMRNVKKPLKERFYNHKTYFRKRYMLIMQIFLNRYDFQEKKTHLYQH